MPFPIAPDPGTNESEVDFIIQDPFVLRRAVTPVFAVDLHDGMLREPRTGRSMGLGTSFYITSLGRQLSAMHVITDFFNEEGIVIRPDRIKTLIQPKDCWIAIFNDPGLVLGGARITGRVLYATDFVMFPVDQLKRPDAIISSADQLNYLEPELDLTSWNILGLSENNTLWLPIRVGCRASVKEGDRVLAIGYPAITSWRRSSQQIVPFQEEMRGSIGKVIKVERDCDPDRRIWPTIVVDAHWKSGMSGGPVFNEDAEVVGIVSRSANPYGDSSAWSRALWLEPLPYRSDIFGP